MSPVFQYLLLQLQSLYYKLIGKNLGRGLKCKDHHLRHTLYQLSILNRDALQFRLPENEYLKYSLLGSRSLSC